MDGTAYINGRGCLATSTGNAGEQPVTNETDTQFHCIKFGRPLASRRM
jgi:hypothetical protein